MPPETLELSTSAFSSLVSGDRAELGKQHPDFSADPKSVLENALAQLKGDEQARSKYDSNLLLLVHGTSGQRLMMRSSASRELQKHYLARFLDTSKFVAPNTLPSSN